MRKRAGRRDTDAEEVATKMSAPAALAAARTFRVPSMLTRLVRSQRSSERSPGRIVATVWNTVSGRRETSPGQGLARAASTEAGSVTSVFT